MSLCIPEGTHTLLRCDAMPPRGCSAFRVEPVGGPTRLDGRCGAREFELWRHAGGRSMAECHSSLVWRFNI